jgi:hypothetical protein
VNSRILGKLRENRSVRSTRFGIRNENSSSICSTKSFLSAGFYRCHRIVLAAAESLFDYISISLANPQTESE